MDLFILDDQLRRIELIDRYESLLWAERFSAYGDFELVISSNRQVRSLLQTGTRLAINESTRVMAVETIVDKIGDDGRSYLTVKGPSLEESMNDRMAKETLAGTVAEPEWELTGTPADIAREIFQHICVDGSLDAGDIIPFYTTGSIYPTDTIPEPDGVLTIKIPPSTVYDVIKELCDIFDLGFRLVRNLDNSELMFNIYAGNDRTTLQSVLDPVIFAPELDNLKDISYLTSISAYKNVAYVVAPNGSAIAYAPGIDSTVSGFERKVLHVDASDINLAAGAPLTAALIQRGERELAKASNLAAFDGEIPQFGSYKYGVDYELGDLVEIRNNDGLTNNMRVTEQIFVRDAQGFRSYPTLAVKLLITPGSWLAWDSSQAWADVPEDSDHEWEDMP